MPAALDLRLAGPIASVPVQARYRSVGVLKGAIVLLPLTNLGRIPWISSDARDVPIVLNDIAVLVVIAAGLLVAMQGRRIVFDRVAGFALAFAAVGATSALAAVPRFGLSITELVLSTAYLLRWLAYFGIYLVIINTADRSDALSIWRFVERAILVFAAFGILQSLFLPGFAQIVDPGAGWDVQGHRLVSTVLDPNFAGAMIFIPLLVQFAVLTLGGRVAAWKPVLLLTALLMTISRSSILGFIAGMGLILMVRGLSKRLLAFGTGVLLLLVPFTPLILSFANSFGRFSLEGSASMRFISWMRAIEVLTDNPIIGVGFNTYGFVQRVYGYAAAGASDFALDGGLLFIGVMTGVVGMVLYVALLSQAACYSRRIWRDPRQAPEHRGLALGAAAATFGLVVHSIFLNSLLLSFIMEMLWILWGVVFLISRREQGHHHDRGDPSSTMVTAPAGA